VRDEWESRYRELLDLRRQRGGDLLGAPLPAEGGLRTWAAFQRQQWRKGVLAAERCAGLCCRLLGMQQRV
jgi:hypothetical protein